MLITHPLYNDRFATATEFTMPNLISFRSAQFLTSSPDLASCPPESGSEVAFAGRSNAGKSSAINTLTHNGKLARTSKTPGRTQMINFFQLDSPEIRLVDLPGYGYAKVPIKMKELWQQNLSNYLHQRQSLRGLILLMDIRHPLQEYDAMMLNWSAEASMPVHILLTKSDKLKRGAARNTLFAVEKHLQEANVKDLVSVQTFSAHNNDGLAMLEKTLTHWLLEPAEGADFPPAQV